MLKIVHFNLCTVVREIFPGGERAYRHWPISRTWDYSPDHKDYWVSVIEQDVPDRFKAAALRGGQR